MKVVVFCGGRGARFLTSELLRHPHVSLTCAVNGYDDGLSTGAVRRLLGRSLGPSDFRKNANHMASEMRTAGEELLRLLEMRTPAGLGEEAGRRVLRLMRGLGRAEGRFEEEVERLGRQAGAGLTLALEAFERQIDQAGPFDFGGLCLGNAVFGGGILNRGMDFNAAVEDYCALVGLPAGIVENVTDGTDAYLVAVTAEGRLLTEEGDIVDASIATQIGEIELLRARWPEGAAAGGPEARERVRRMKAELRPNGRLLSKLREADLVIYAPGTPHSSLYPSYLTPGVGEALADNLRAPKILVTNLRQDAGVRGRSAVELVEDTQRYLKRRGELALPGPSLVTHYVLNDPASESEARVPLGVLDSLSDPRLVRMANYEDGEAGGHDARKVLLPFLETHYREVGPWRVAVVLVGTKSEDKIAQTAIEMAGVAGGREAARIEVFHGAGEALDGEFARRLPFVLRRMEEFAAEEFEYVVLLDSGGAYRGEELGALLGHLKSGRLDAVWGSRRLSVGDIRQAYRLVYRKNPLKGLLSRAGSQMLSLACLGLHGRYVSDTLSGARVVRAHYLAGRETELERVDLNHALLAAIQRAGGELLEVPVRYFPLSPERTRRTKVRDGLLGLMALAAGRSGPRPERRFPQVVFDMDGVLVDSSACHERAFAQLWEKLGVEGPGYETIAGRPTREVVKEVTAGLRSPRTEEWSAWKQELAMQYLQTAELLYDDTLECVRALRRMGCRLGVATGASRRNAEAVLGRCGLLRYFAAVVTSDDVRKGKPAPDPFTLAIAECGYAPEETLVVEDSAAGLKAALEAGAYAMSVRSGVKSEGRRFVGAYGGLRDVVGVARSER